MATVMTHDGARGDLTLPDDHMEISSDIGRTDMDDHIDIDFDLDNEGGRPNEDHAMEEYDGIENVPGTDDIMDDGSEIDYDRTERMPDAAVVQDEVIPDLESQPTDLEIPDDGFENAPETQLTASNLDPSAQSVVTTNNNEPFDPNVPVLTTSVTSDVQSINPQGSVADDQVSLNVTGDETLEPAEPPVQTNPDDTASLEDEITYSERDENEATENTVQGDFVENFEDDEIQRLEHEEEVVDAQEEEQLEHVLETNEYTAEEVAASIMNPKSLPHPIVLVWEQEEYSLFEPKHNQQDNGYFLLDNAVAEGPLENFTAAVRNALGDSCAEDHEIQLYIADLGLTICEDTHASLNPSISHLLDIYLTLCQNENVDKPDPLYINLYLTNGFRARLNSLYRAVDEHKPLSQALADNQNEGYNEGADDYNEQGEGHHEYDEEEEFAENEHGDSSAQTEQTHDPNDADYNEAQGENFDEEQVDDEDYDENEEFDDGSGGGSNESTLAGPEVGHTFEDKIDEYVEEEEDDFSAEADQEGTAAHENLEDNNDGEFSNFEGAGEGAEFLSQGEQDFDPAQSDDEIDYEDEEPSALINQSETEGTGEAEFEIDYTSHHDDGEAGEGLDDTADVEQEIEDFFPDIDVAEENVAEADLFDEITYDDDDNTTGNPVNTIPEADVSSALPASKKRSFTENSGDGNGNHDGSGPGAKKARSS